MRLICAILLASAGAAAADEWRPQDGAGIRAALTGRIVDYEAAWQRFEASGQRLCNAGDVRFRGAGSDATIGRIRD